MDLTPRYNADDNRYDGRMPYSRCGKRAENAAGLAWFMA